MKAPTTRASPTKSYMWLVRIFPLTPIRDDDHARDASRMLAYVLSLSEEDPGVVDYLDVLTTLVEAYESRGPIPDGSPTDALVILMEQRGLTASRLASEAGIGRASLASALRGVRPISAAQAVSLGEYFGVAPQVFLPDRGHDSPRPTAQPGEK
ncbi:helix-turn-helix domain-containing protein [Paludisphaera sp.]|uniref:helix-turn-helix domain-containing protein n=1 Tax=Paludisphaera sp. TaxID=2017432 RepID=UPI00301C2A6D